MAKVIRSSGLQAGEQVTFIWLYDVHVDATYGHEKPTDNPLVSCSLRSVVIN